MSSFTVRKASGYCGAYVEGPGLQEIVASNDLTGDIRNLALEHEVLFLRDQAVPAAEFESFAKLFGEVLEHPAYGTVPGAPSVQVLESTPEEPTKIELWHSDMTFSATPPSFTILHGQIIPDAGGDTLWASATAAFAGLSPSMQGFLRPLRAEHDFRFGFRESLAEPGGEARLARAIADNPPVEHPVVRTHPETGREALFVNPLFTKRICGLNHDESESLLTMLYGHLTTAEYTVRLGWQPNTVAIWDNRSVQHKPINDYFPAHRKLHRVTIKGDPPC